MHLDKLELEVINKKPESLGDDKIVMYLCVTKKETTRTLIL